jgi:hypothetical protein
MTSHTGRDDLHVADAEDIASSTVTPSAWAWRGCWNLGMPGEVATHGAEVLSGCEFGAVLGA